MGTRVTLDGEDLETPETRRIRREERVQRARDAAQLRFAHRHGSHDGLRVPGCDLCHPEADEGTFRRAGHAAEDLRRAFEGTFGRAYQPRYTRFSPPPPRTPPPRQPRSDGLPRLDGAFTPGEPSVCKALYRRLVKVVHPDMGPSPKVPAEIMGRAMSEIAQAYRVRHVELLRAWCRYMEVSDAP
jgi:hypothetical protein